MNLFSKRKAFVRVCSVKDLLMNVGDQFSKDEVSNDCACDTESSINKTL